MDIEIKNDKTEEKENPKTRTVNLSTITAIPFRGGDYYIEGPSIVVYDASGGNPSYYKDPYKIYKNGSKEEAPNAVWGIIYYNEDGWAVPKEPNDTFT
jgi:hypothetical protein